MPTTTKTVSSDNLARFKQKCDETYAKIGEGGGSGPEIPTPTTADNGKVLGVANGAYSLLNLFPVGAYYITESATTPASLFGGSWMRVSGYFLYGAASQASVGLTGGEAQHTLTANEMPAHGHKLNGWVVITSYGSNSGKFYMNEGTNSLFNIFKDDTDQNRYSENTGGGAAHNNMPPYRQVNIWRRTA